ncbi:NADPH-dependent FMN reductase [Thelonectria olida]|uniref:NADPH-dependent FMN reductase n=1 Tax=Thelonectria olida TaxID=1576542 RepID=A0A9P8VRW4_9HYPO|nr:NADPH-dependent FMN reductase [Thelonectria olida]
MAKTHNVVVLSMSTRNPRVGPKIAEFVRQTLSKDATDSSIDLSLVDVNKFNLPLYDEALAPMQVPAQGQFAHEHSIAWSAEIAKHDAYILVIPEYNHGVSGGTKNAVDYLCNEWIGKPAAIVSYGNQGGIRASSQLNETLGGMRLRVAATRPALTFARDTPPDVYGAVSQGILGEASRKTWAAEKTSELLQAFQEVKELLKESPEGSTVAKV